MMNQQMAHTRNPGTYLLVILACAFTCVLGLLGMGLLSASSVHAQSRLNTIGFVDIPYLIDKAPQAVEAASRLEMEFAPRQESIKLQREELSDIQNRLETESLELSESDKGELERDARALERRLKRDEQDFREELSIQKNNEFKKVRILVLEAIARFGKDNNYDLIVSDGVLYANASIDVTETVLEYLIESNQLNESSN